MISSFAPGESLVLVRNPYFREWSRAAQPEGYPDRIVLRVLEESEGPVSVQDVGLRKVLEDEVDLVVAYGSFRGSMQELRTRYPAQLHPERGNYMQYMQLNTELAPFDDVRARRALSFAVDRPRMERLWVGSKDALEPSCQLLPPGFPGYAPYCPYSRDMAEARRLVAESGTTGALVTVGVAKAQKAFGNYLANVLESIGYRAEVTIFKSANAFDGALRQAATLHMVPFGWGPDFPQSSQYLEPVLGCVKSLEDDPGSINLGGFCAPGVQKDIDMALALQATEPAAAARLWQQVDHAAIDLAAVLPIGILTEAIMTSSRVGNYQYQPVYGVLLDQLWVQ
jgi:peptide/nickel transport system substrate-binding protein